MNMIKKLLVGLLILLLVGCHGIVPPPDPDPDPEPTPVEYRGFFVGITDYESYGDAKDLYSPAINTEKLEELFNNSAYEFEMITRLTDHDATKENILNGIAETFAGADENDISYFYWMGHGGVKLNEPVICPTDYQVTDFFSYITVHELEFTLSQIPGVKVVLLETCHSGNFIDRNGYGFDQQVIDIFAQAPLDLLNKYPYQVLTASKGDEYAWDCECGSYFCKHFIFGCDGLTADRVYKGNNDSVVSLEEIHAYLKAMIERQTAQIYPEGSQFPIYEE